MTHPYRNLPAYTRWSRAVAEPACEAINPIVDFPFKIAPEDKVATAGSCFAQHIARRLKSSGYNYFVTEPGHPLADESIAERYNYRIYSARYANLYTTRQLVQLIERAYGERTPLDNHWVTEGGRFADPLRPTIEPNGFSSLAELEADREQHLASVRCMFEELDVFVFTLGLTEAWIDKADGTVFPVCPGVAGGKFDPDRHMFHNFSVGEVVEDLHSSIDRILAVNPKARFILTVSPVPLIATAEDRHVLVSTTYSKSVLRVACDEVARSYSKCTGYFPSYEIIMGAFNRGRYFAEDLRSVTEAGVSHVMRVFMETISTGAGNDFPSTTSGTEGFSELSQLAEAQRVVCEEELIELARKQEEFQRKS
ncbi:GSCFA domain-containing protein [Burkholderia gladioli]|uniref:GSCFA domain-containing protein n=1 Tax=Burkholderia gladioli TaxID=28095 RepID=UPI001642162C|nr:GSCFA domain-containing protein [Burkholderia gladioli]